MGSGYHQNDTTGDRLYTSGHLFQETKKVIENLKSLGENLFSYTLYFCLF